MRTFLLSTLVAGCGWNALPRGGSYDTDRLWDPDGIVATEVGLYVPLPATGGVALVRPDGTWEPLDATWYPFGLAPARARDLVRVPGTDDVVAFLDTIWCDEDPGTRGRPPRYLEDCPEDLRRVETEIAVLSPGGFSGRTPVPGHLNALTFSPDGSVAIATFDASRGGGVSGVVNLTEIAIYDLEAGMLTPVRVGFAADRVLFSEDGARAVVLSQSEVAVVDLTRDPPATAVTFPLTLDPDQVVDPIGVALTPDGTHALIPVAGRGDLYVLDLVDPSVNLVSLAASPGDVWVDPVADQTLLVYPGARVLEILDHDRFDLRTVSLDEAMDRIVPADGFAVLHGTRGQKDVYRYDLASGDLVEYRLQNPAYTLQVAPGGDFAVAFTGPEGSGAGGVEGFYDGRPGMEILDLRPGEDDVVPYALDGLGVGVAFDVSDDGVWALVLQQGVEALWKGELVTGVSETIELSAPPVSIGAFPTGGFYVAHDEAFGLVTFYDPATDETIEAAGFGLSGFLEEPEPAEVPR